MTTVVPLAYQHVRNNAALIAQVTIVLAVLALLAFVVLSLVAHPGLRLDGPELAPFRWTPPDAVA